MTTIIAAYMDGDTVCLQTASGWFATSDNSIRQTLALGYDDFSLVALSGYQHDGLWKPARAPDIHQMTKAYPSGELSPDELTPNLVGC